MYCIDKIKGNLTCTLGYSRKKKQVGLKTCFFEIITSGINSNVVTIAPYALFRTSFSLNPLWDLPYKTGKLPTDSGSSYSLDISGETFFYFFNFLSKSFLFICKNLLVHLFYLKSFNFFSS